VQLIYIEQEYFVTTMALMNYIGIVATPDQQPKQLNVCFGQAKIKLGEFVDGQ